MVFYYVRGLISFASTVVFFMYIRHIWIKPVLCSRMISVFHHTSPWTHSCSQSSPSAHRNGRVFRRSVQTACCYWNLNRGKFPPIEIHRRMQAVYGDQCVDVSTVRWWVRWSVLVWVQYDGGKVKCVDVSTVRRWVRWSVQWGNGLWWSVCWCE